jgi:ParB-like chromosome segregation protein Spo0J
MSSPKIHRSKPQNLTSNFDVRARLDDDRILFFAGLYESGAEVEPIQCTDEGHIVDGRHRREGAILAEMKTVNTVIVKDKDPVRLIGLAFRANAGGALPPTREDIEHTISRLLEYKVSHQNIAEVLGLPPSIVRKLITNIRSGAAHAKLRRAAHAVLEEGKTVTKAAEEFDVDVDVLRERMGGRARKRGKASVQELKTRLSRSQLGVSKSNGELIKRLIEEFQDGEKPEAAVLEIIEHLIHLNAQVAGRLQDWLQRFNVARGQVTPANVDKSASTKRSSPKKTSNGSVGKAAMRRMGLTV